MDALWISIQAYTNEVWSGSGYLQRSSVAKRLMNNHLIYTQEDDSVLSHRRFTLEVTSWHRGQKKRRKILNIAMKLQEEDGTTLTRTAKVLRSRVESKHAAENMSHGLVRIIFCFNWTQIPQYDSRASAVVSTLVQPFPTLVIDNCKQTKLLSEKYDAGQKDKKSYLGQIDARSVYHNRSSWVTSPQTHVTAAAVGLTVHRLVCVCVDARAE